MPPFLAAPAVRPLRFDTSLTDDQITLITDWVAAGAPMGDAGDPAPPIVLPERELDRVDRVVGMPSPYTPTTLPDEYRCFVLDWAETEPTFITGVEFMPDNLAIAHHAVIYLVEEQYTEAITSADGADGKMGYSCFGGASPDGAESFPTKLVAGWGPGVGAIAYPEGTGALVQPGTKVVLQMHYSILDGGAQPDQSEVAFSLADTVERNAGYLPWLDANWPTNPESMLIPAGDPAVVHEYVADPTQSTFLDEFVPGADPRQGLVISSVLPHLHKLGKSISLQVERANGVIEPLVTIARWDFNWQGEFEFAEPVTVLPGDRVRITCTWDNSAENQPVIQGVLQEPQDVTWGEGTFDEMCAASLFVYEVAAEDLTCEDFGAQPSESGRFVATFDAPEGVRNSASLEGQLMGPVWGSIYRDEDVTLLGPIDGAQPVGSFQIPSLDLRDGPSDPIEIDVDLPAGDYQVLGFMDTDGNAATTGESPDPYDPVMIPSVARTLECDRQPTLITFPILLPQ
jgi:hypothetical protein